MLDLTSHIVGLGQKEFAAVLRDPALAAERARRGDYRESFAYVFHAALQKAPAEDLLAALRAHVTLLPLEEGRPFAPGEVLDHPLWGPGLVVADDAVPPGRARALFCDGTSLPLRRAPGRASETGPAGEREANDRRTIGGDHVQRGPRTAAAR